MLITFKHGVASLLRLYQQDQRSARTPIFRPSKGCFWGRLGSKMHQSGGARSQGSGTKDPQNCSRSSSSSGQRQSGLFKKLSKAPHNSTGQRHSIRKEPTSKRDEIRPLDTLDLGMVRSKPFPCSHAPPFMSCCSIHSRCSARRSFSPLSITASARVSMTYSISSAAAAGSSSSSAEVTSSWTHEAALGGANAESTFTSPVVCRFQYTVFFEFCLGSGQACRGYCAELKWPNGKEVRGGKREN